MKERTRNRQPEQSATGSRGRPIMVRVTLPSEGLSPRSDRHAHAQCGLVGPSRVTARTGLAGRSDGLHTGCRLAAGVHGPSSHASPASIPRGGTADPIETGGRSHRRVLSTCPAPSRRAPTTGHDTRPTGSLSTEPRPALSPANATERRSRRPRRAPRRLWTVLVSLTVHATSRTGA